MLQGSCLRPMVALLGVLLLAHFASAQSETRDLPAQSSAIPETHLLTTQAVPSPAVVTSLAVMPGVIVHGFGHFYVGRPEVGAMLLAAEAGSLVLMARGGSDLWDALGNGRAANLTNGTSSTGQFSRGVGLAAGGLMLFLASWFYDISGAPLAINSPVPRVSSQVSERGMELALNWQF